MGLRDWLDRRRIRKGFAQYVSPSVIEMIEKDPSSYLEQGPERRNFQYLLINVHDMPLHEIPDRMPPIFRSCFHHHANLTGGRYSLLLATIAAIYPDADPAEKRRALVRELLEQNHRWVRIAHGECEGLVGNIGERECLSFETVVPNLTAITERLFQSAFGTAIEIIDTPTPTPRD